MPKTTKHGGGSNAASNVRSSILDVLVDDSATVSTNNPLMYERPADYAQKSEWVNWAVLNGYSEMDAWELTVSELKEIGSESS